MKTHTPGPWEILTTNRKTYVVTNALSQPFVGQVIAGPTTCPDWESNAHLIASAPELLSALEFVSGILSQPVFLNDSIDSAASSIMRNDAKVALHHIANAIAKAKGQL